MSMMKWSESWGRVARGFAVAAVLGTSLAAAPAVSAASAGSADPVQPAGASVQSDTYVQLIARHSGKCLYVTGSSKSNGAYLQQYTCLGWSSQRWLLKPIIFTGAGTYYEIISQNSGKCVDIEGASMADRARAQQYTCHGGDNQLFLQVFYGGGPSFVARHSGKCLDVEGDYVTDHAKVWQYTCDYDLNQQWVELL
jgi:hypothetical protein